MGISLPTAKMLMEIGNGRPFSGEVLQLGRQDIAFDEQDLQRAAAEMQFPLRPEMDAEAAPDAPGQGNRRMMDDVAFFRRLGFAAVRSLDASDFEGASIVFDLNAPDPPSGCVGAFDVILDGGTLEHVFHLPNALGTIAAMLKPDGLVIHASPVNNCMDHGFYCFSPTLFFDFYRANGFEVLTAQLVRYNPYRHVNRAQRAFLFPAQPGVRQLSRMGTLDHRCYAIFFVARKVAGSSIGVVPQQSSYVEVWSEGSDGGKAAAGGKSRARKWLRKASKKNAVLEEWYRLCEARLATRFVQWQNL